MARGDKRLPEKMYPVMKKYVKACKFRAGFGFGKHRYIYGTRPIFCTSATGLRPT